MEFRSGLFRSGQQILSAESRTGRVRNGLNRTRLQRVGGDRQPGTQAVEEDQECPSARVRAGEAQFVWSVGENRLVDDEIVEAALVRAHPPELFEVGIGKPPAPPYSGPHPVSDAAGPRSPAHEPASARSAQRIAGRGGVRTG